MEPELFEAVERLLGPNPAHWVTVATVARDGGPHATPMVLGWDRESLYLSLTGKQKVRNLERDPRVCVSISRDEDLAHAVVWGTVAMSSDQWAQERWERMTERWAGRDQAAKQWRRLSPDGTQLGVITPTRWRVYGLSAVGRP